MALQNPSPSGRRTEEGKEAEKERGEDERQIGVRAVSGKEGVPFPQATPTLHPCLFSLTRSSRIWVMYYCFAVETRYHG